MPIKTENRGGARPGAGRKSTVTPKATGELREILMDAHNRFAEEYEKSLGDIILEIAYNKQRGRRRDVPVAPTTQLAAAKLFLEYTAAKTTEQEINVTQQTGPAIYLPEEDPVAEAPTRVQ